LATTDALEPTTAEVVVGELRNHATCRSGSRVFRTSLEARSEVEKKQPSYVVNVSLVRIEDNFVSGDLGTL